MYIGIGTLLIIILLVILLAVAAGPAGEEVVRTAAQRWLRNELTCWIPLGRLV